MMSRPNICLIGLLFLANILLFINIMIQYADKSYYLSPIKSRSTTEIAVNVQSGKVPQQIPTILNDDVPIHMENKPIRNSDIENKPIVLQDETLSDRATIILEEMRLKIKHDTYNFNFSPSGVSSLEDLVMESGGQPQISIVVSTWRSGSTFTSYLINKARPGTYFQNEPLFPYGTHQFRSLTEAREAISVVKRVLKCNYKGLEDFFESQRIHFTKWSNTNWKNCNYEDDLCYDKEVISRLCKLFPFQSVKLERLRLQLVEEILKDKALNVKVILLVRDPRGVMQSRRHEHFCQLSSDCCDSSKLCSDMVSDYVAAVRLLQLYPDRMMVLRFEELALQPFKTSDRILNFLKVERTQAFDEFLESHTNVEEDGPHALSRVSRNVPYKWRNLLSFHTVNEIQMDCREAMRLWGYKMAHNNTHVTSKDFNPIGDYTITL